MATARARRERPSADIVKAIPGLPVKAAAFVEPMQPESVADLPTGPQWQYEAKWDGYRAIAVKSRGKVTVYSRRRNLLTIRYPAVSKVLEQISARSFVIDGEIIALDAKGRPSFQLLQNAGKQHPGLVFVAFDLLNIDGRSLRGLPLSKRQELLQLATRGSDVQVSLPIDDNLKAAIRAVRRLRWEGIVAKKRSSPYRPGVRGGSWYKHRLDRGQEFVIGGFSGGGPFEGLLAGYYEERQLIYAGKVKAGYTPTIRRELFRRLERLVTNRCPFANLPEDSSGRWGEGLTAAKMKKCTWLKPRLVMQVNFVEWTGHGHLRHAKFLGLRDDKRPADVIRESWRGGG